MSVHRTITLRPAAALLGAAALAGALALPAAAGASGNGSSSAAQLVRQSAQATQGAKAVTVSANLTQGNQHTSFQLATGTSGNGVGTVTVNGQTIHVVKLGSTTYFKADNAFWTANGGQAAAQIFANKWLKAPSSDPDFSQFNSFFNLRSLLGSSSAPVGSARKVGTATVNGQPAIVIKGGDSSSSGTVWVAAKGRPYVLKIQASGSGTSGTITFTHYGQSLHPSAPKGAISYTALKQAGSGAG
jgi:hypothetical protein